jgi:uncharacterized protein
MLKVDLARLRREWRILLQEEVAPEAEIGETADARFRGPIGVDLEAQQAGEDVVVRGQVTAELELECRRCLEPVAVELDEPVTFLFRPGLTPTEAEEAEAYTFESNAGELDLAPAVREHVLLSMPRYAVCSEACRGFCPRCGRRLGEGECACEEPGGDERWGPLRNLKLD